MSCSSSCRVAAAAALAPPGVPPSASRAPRPTAPERCFRRRAAALFPRRAGQSPSRRLGLRRPRGGRARILRQDRSRSAARTCGLVRLRGADRGRRGRQHGAGRAGRVGCGGRPRRRRLERGARARSSRARARSSPSISRTKSSPSPARSGRRIPSTPARRTRSRQSALCPAAGSRSLSTWPAPCRRSNSPMPRPPAAGRPSPLACRHPDKRLSLAPVTLVAEERTLKGSYIGSAAPLRDVPRYIALFKAGKLAGRRAADPSAQARGDQRGVRPTARRDRGQAGGAVFLTPA